MKKLFFLLPLFCALLASCTFCEPPVNDCSITPTWACLSGSWELDTPQRYESYTFRNDSCIYELRTPDRHIFAYLQQTSIVSDTITLAYLGEEHIVTPPLGLIPYLPKPWIYRIQVFPKVLIMEGRRGIGIYSRRY